MKLPGTDYVLSLFDKDTQNEFTEFLEDRKQPKAPATQELTSHGGKLSDVWTGDQFLGAYNPETVTVDTFDKMRKHPQIAEGLACIKLPILATAWTVKSQDKDIASFVKQTLDPIWRELVRSTLTALDFGWACHEKVWEYRDLNLTRQDEKGNPYVFFDRRAIVYKKLKSLHPNWITIRMSALDDLLGITQIYRGNQVQVDANKVFIFTHQRGENFGNLYGTSRLKNVYDIWYWWMLLSQFMLRYFERRGSPTIVVRFPTGKSKEGESHSQIALKLGKYAVNENVVTLPSVTGGDKIYKWDIDYLKDDKRGEMFTSALNSLEIKMLRGLFVPERVLTQDFRTGSYALSRTHFNVYIMTLDGLIADIEDQFTRYIVRPLVEYNFGANAPQVYLEMERLSQQRTEFLAQIFTQMLKDGRATPAVKRIADVLQVPIEEESIEPAKKEPEPQEKLELEDKKKERTWWRELKPYENAKILEDIEDRLDSQRKEFPEKLDSVILQPQLDMVIKEVAKALKGKQPLKNIWFELLKATDEYGRVKEVKVPWEPLKSKLQSLLSGYIQEMYTFGQKTAIEEMDLKDKPKADSGDLDILKSRAIAVSDRWLSNIKYGVEMATLNVTNKTETDIKWDVKQVFEKFKNKNLPDIAETEGMTALNLGRRRVVLRHS